MLYNPPEMKPIDFLGRAKKKVRSVPVLTFAKGKFTLSLESLGRTKFLCVYNTATKVEIARRPAGDTKRDEWVRWAEAVVQAWQQARGRARE